eukprot:TRINITY_DN2129_c0_g1_i5.p2 TRINITY_DN2129_c0_g1~~TRINITY_DN2129_c0_g1_i5.p2  ORF type:complete len:320 (-),score=60.02 TRINITY_DN2129_c0_g1_i5:2999-3958(-)
MGSIYSDQKRNSEENVIESPTVSAKDSLKLTKKECEKSFQGYLNYKQEKGETFNPNLKKGELKALYSRCLDAFWRELKHCEKERLIQQFLEAFPEPELDENVSSLEYEKSMAKWEGNMDAQLSFTLRDIDLWKKGLCISPIYFKKIDTLLQEEINQILEGEDETILRSKLFPVKKNGEVEIPQYLIKRIRDKQRASPFSDKKAHFEETIREYETFFTDSKHEAWTVRIVIIDFGSSSSENKCNKNLGLIPTQLLNWGYLHLGIQIGPYLIDLLDREGYCDIRIKDLSENVLMVIYPSLPSTVIISDKSLAVIFSSNSNY